MDFIERIQDVAKRLQTFREAITNEQATKNSLIEPFIKALGYDTSNPLEVALEFTNPDNFKKDSRVDYAILDAERKPIILIEAKTLGTTLEPKTSQLDWYFHKTNARIGILTDGNRYQFFSDMDEKNKMDAKPFMEIVLETLNTSLLPELQKMAKDKFDVDNLLEAAGKLKHYRTFRRVLAQQFEEPDEEFVKFFFRQATPQGSMFTNAAKERVTPILKKAMKEFLNDFLSDTVNKNLLDKVKQPESPEANIADEPIIIEPAPISKIQTTELEKEAYYLVKSLLVGIIEPERIILKDGIHFCNILLDGSIQKPIFRLYFNNEEKLRVATFDQEKNETKVDIANLNDILPLADKIRERAATY